MSVETEVAVAPRSGRASGTREGANVRYEQITKRFGSVEAVIELNLELADGAFVALLGPSGCGKTTTLRVLAGLEQPTAGRVFIGERDVTSLPPKDRDVAMVFQNYALYPHMTVAANIAYPLKVRGLARTERDTVVRRVAEALRIGSFLNRRPRELSGGQRQRVALARAIVRRPLVFLLDEPLSNLDAKLRVQMRGELKHLQKELGTTTLYVTHDQSEATTMASVVVVMNNGAVEQIGAPREIYESPRNRFVATFVGSPAMNILDVEFAADGLVTQSGDSLGLSDPTVERIRASAAGRPVSVGVRAEAVRAAETGGLECEVFAVQPMDHETFVTFHAEGVAVTGRFGGDPGFVMGEPARISVDEERLHVFDRERGETLLSTGNNVVSGTPLRAKASGLAN